MFWRRKSARNRRKEAAGGTWGLPAINWRRLLPAGAILVVTITAFVGVRAALDQPVQRVDVTGTFQRVQQQQVHKSVRDAIGRKGMVAVDLEAVSRAVKRDPWVDRASVARRWPRTLQVYVVEQVPVARWGEAGLLNARGEVFVRDSSHLPAELPEFAGPHGSETQMTERFLLAQKRLTGAGLRLSRLRLDERGVWEIELDNGVQLRFGREGFEERFDRFIAAAAGIVSARAAEIRYVDLRYANGFAIGWRTAGEVNRG
jgi:cell division protein FtsQ